MEAHSRRAYVTTAAPESNGPEPRETLTKVFRANLDDSIRFHLDAGLPGDEVTVVVLYLAMSGLLVDDITVPDVLSAYPDGELVADLVDRILPPSPE
ncbi:hypothetical protein [Phytohabitans houttuyneae]|uniref:Tetracyclin repressor-like C-terminal group 31 domain-containing protein n=1 Tax=Phytohabitans houttuyneae TaxID=1076126 RepID=A0A6V8JUA7_9ACTN|nr:hypothetical protein [Phytohabitans houttuyneae]GFJ76162.1 hypothetical protein Phou_003420 [Phytohabitans houttuyneae]